MSIDRSEFAEECIRQGLYCGVNPHYLLGVAQLRSGISEGSQNGEAGPFRLTQEQWNTYRSDSEFDFHFLPNDINDWDMQCPVFALMAHRAFDLFAVRNGRNPSAKELYLEQWPNASTTTLSADFQKALSDTAELVDPAAARVLDEPDPLPLKINNPDQQPSGPPTGPFRLGTVSPTRRAIAQKVLDAFAGAGLGRFQQAAGLANAIAELGLDPSAHAAIGEDSWGLFQLNRAGGLGVGHNPDELVNPDRNIAIVIAEAKKYTEFTTANSLERAVSAFVRDVERPHDVSGAIVKRLKIAQNLLPSTDQAPSGQGGPSGPSAPSPGSPASAISGSIRTAAIREWEFFGQQTYDINGHGIRVGHKEGEEGWYERVSTYWRDGANINGIDGRDHDSPWSAAFISWVMKTGGAGNRFRYSSQHSVYINQAIRDFLQGRAEAGFWGRRLNEQKPKIGDLVCWARQAGVDYAHQLQGNYAGHCDIVIDVRSDEIDVIGGNVGNSVTKRPLSLTSGFLKPRQNLFALMENRLDLPVGVAAVLLPASAS